MSTTIEGSAGLIEIVVDKPQKNIKSVAVLSHPHPLHGGSLTNKVIHTASKACVAQNIIAVRHNFRGVGLSQGTHDNGIGEYADILLVIKYAKEQFPNLPLIIIGFSFGAALSIGVAQTQPKATLITIAPPIYSYIDKINYIPNKWYLIMGEQDEIVDVSEVKQWLKKQQKKPTNHWIENTGHFFHGKLNVLKQTIELILKNSSC